MSPSSPTEAPEASFHAPLRAWFFTIARLEGVSLLLLFFVAMPLKYAAGIPEPVAWVGWAHGALFLLYLVAWSSYLRVFRPGWLWAGLGAAASLVPFGTFILERQLPEA